MGIEQRLAACIRHLAVPTPPELRARRLRSIQRLSNQRCAQRYLLERAARQA